MILRACLILCVLFSSPSAHAFGHDIHRVVAALAEAQLTPAARQQVPALLAREPGATLVSVSSWADDTRSRSTAASHYINFPEGSCEYVPERDCAGGRCVVSAIRQQVNVLRLGDDDSRLRALKFLVHFVADIHQPLHAGHAADKGGNLYQVHAFGKGTNLHALWDRGLVEARPGGAEQLQHELSTQQGRSAVDSTLAPARWAEESCRIAASDGFYPSSRAVGAAYLQQFDATFVSALPPPLSALRRC